MTFEIDLRLRIHGGRTMSDWRKKIVGKFNQERDDESLRLRAAEREREQVTKAAPRAFERVRALIRDETEAFNRELGKNEFRYEVGTRGGVAISGTNLSKSKIEIEFDEKSGMVRGELARFVGAVGHTERMALKLRVDEDGTTWYEHLRDDGQRVPMHEADIAEPLLAQLFDTINAR